MDLVSYDCESLICFSIRWDEIIKISFTNVNFLCTYFVAILHRDKTNMYEKYIQYSKTVKIQLIYIAVRITPHPLSNLYEFKRTLSKYL